MTLQESSPTAANAIRHGLSGTRHVPKEAQAELAQIAAELIEIKQPNTPEEFEIVHNMSIAQWQVGQHSKRQVEHLQMQIARASEIFDAKELKKFQELQTNWLADPAAHAEAMANSYLGVKHFAHIWKAMSESLGPEGVGLSLKMTCQAVAAEGISPHPDEIFGQGDWLMKRFLATTASPTESVHEWLDKYGVRKSKISNDRGEKLYLSSPEPGLAHKELQARAQEKYQYWDNLMEKRRKDYDLAKIQFTQANAGNGMGDKEMENQVRLMHRYRTAAQNRFDRYDRQLKAGKATSLRRTQQLFAWEQREKERAINRDLKLARLTDQQYHQYQESVEYNEFREVRRSRNSYYNPNQPIYGNAYESTYEPYRNTEEDPQTGEMTIQAVNTIKEMEQVVNEPPPETKVAISPVPELAPEVQAELNLLIDEVFKTTPQKGMFSHWPNHIMSQAVLPIANAMIYERCQEKAVADELQILMMKEFARRIIFDTFEEKAKQESGAGEKKNRPKLNRSQRRALLRKMR